MSDETASAGVSRRILMRSLILAPAASLLLAGSQRMQAAAATACTMDDSDGLPQSLHYEEKSSLGPSKSCSDCQFWTSAAGGGCGSCEMLHRSTLPTGHCDAWAQKS